MTTKSTTTIAAASSTTTNRRFYTTASGENEITKIPQPSPPQQQFRRSFSLRLRTSDSFNTNELYQKKLSHSTSTSPTKPFRSDKKRLSSSRSLSFITESNKGYNSKGLHQNDGVSTDMSHRKISTNTPSPTKSSCSHQKHHGMTLPLNKDTNCIDSTTSSKHSRSPISPKASTSASSSAIIQTTKLTPKTPPVTPDFSTNGYPDDDLDSLRSFSSMASGRSGMSCDHPYVARNGTTFSGRKMKYVVHCSNYAGQTGEDYLTPTQRAQRHIRRLKELLAQARMDLEQKDSEILRLTKEVVELRLFKASLSSPEDRSNSSDAVTVRENTTSHDISPIVDMTDDGIKSSPRHQLHHPHHHHGIHQVQFMDKMSTSEMQSSFADSGHFEDITTSSMHSKDSFVQTQDVACGNDVDENQQHLIELYEKRIEDLIKNQDTEKQEIKKTHNDRVEALLQKLAECNSRYSDLLPDYEVAKERIRELERQLEALQLKLEEQEDKSNKMYLHMYSKGQEAERMQHADRVLEFAQVAPNRVSVPELMEQLQITQDELENLRDTSYQPEQGSSRVLLSAKEAISLWLLGARKTMYRRLVDAQQTKNKVDPEITLQFLKSAIYYFLTDKENSQGHLNAIESILGFSDLEKLNINRARANK